jgi:hypothetical protein
MERLDKSGWDGEARQDLGRALLRGESEAMTAPELALATGKDQSNMRRLAEELVAEGLLLPRDPPASSGRRGRRPKTAFAFAGGEQEKLEASLQDRGELGRLRPRQQLVFVEATSKMNDLLAVLSDREVMARAAWSGLCDGSRQEFLIAFEGTDAIDASLDLMAALSAAEIRATRASVGKVEPAADLVESARRSLGFSNRSRFRREASRGS